MRNLCTKSVFLNTTVQAFVKKLVAKKACDLPSICLILSIHVESEPFQWFGSSAQIQRPLEGALAAVHHLVDLLKTVGILWMESKTRKKRKIQLKVTRKRRRKNNWEKSNVPTRGW